MAEASVQFFCSLVGSTTVISLLTVDVSSIHYRKV